MATSLDITLLQAFVAVADSGNFTQAARHLHRTQSAVSMQIKKLEELLGKRLLNRDRRNSRITEEGEVLLGYARRMLRLNEEALSSMNRPAMEGLVRLGMPDDYTRRFLPDVLTHFAWAYPRVRLEVVGGALSGLLLDMIEARELDVALVIRQPNRGGGETLLKEQLVWTGSRTHLVYEEDPLPLAVLPAGCVFRERALTALNDSGRRWRIAFCSPSFVAGEIAVSGGYAVTVMAQTLVPPNWRVLGAAEGLPALPQVEVGLYRAPGATSEPAARLSQYLAESVAGHGVQVD